MAWKETRTQYRRLAQEALTRTEGERTVPVQATDLEYLLDELDALDRLRNLIEEKP